MVAPSVVLQPTPVQAQVTLSLSYGVMTYQSFNRIQVDPVTCPQEINVVSSTRLICAFLRQVTGSRDTNVGRSRWEFSADDCSWDYSCLKHTNTKHNAVLTKCITKSNYAFSVEFRPCCGIRQYDAEMWSPVSPLLICSQLKQITYTMLNIEIMQFSTSVASHRDRSSDRCSSALHSRRSATNQEAQPASTRIRRRHTGVRLLLTLILSGTSWADIRVPGRSCVVDAE